MVRAGSARPCQLSLVLLRYVLNGAAMHILRTVPPRLSARLAEQIDRWGARLVEQRIITSEIADADPAATERALRQAALPCSGGGLGLARAVDVAPIAFYAGLAQAAALGLLRLVADGGHDSPSQQWLQSVLDSAPLQHYRRDPRLREAFSDILPPEGAGLKGVVQMFTAQQQRVVAGREGRGRRVKDGRTAARKVQQRLWRPWKEQLSQQFRRDYAHDPATLQRVDSAQGRVAAGYLTCLPRTEALSVPDADFCIATRLRLGVAVSKSLP